MKRTFNLLNLALVLLGVAAATLARAESDGSWRFSGNDITNSRSQDGWELLSPASARFLKTKWVFTTTGDVSATPTVEGNAVYVVDWGGSLFRIGAHTGQPVWTHKISDYTNNVYSFSRTSPAITDTAIILGDRGSPTMLAVDKTTGSLLWKTTVDTDRYGFITASAVVARGVVYVGTSSAEEYYGTQPNFTTTFRGSVVALDAKTGAILWQTFMVPPGYTGGAVWSSTAAVDLKRNSLYVTSGNNYTVPPAVTTCVTAAGADMAKQIACLDPADYIDAIISLDLTTGKPKWVRRLQGADTWNVACISGTAPPCPLSAGPDNDFGAGPNLFHVGGPEGGPFDRREPSHRALDIVGAGQKSGMYWALNPDTGATIWARQVGPAGDAGGILWGTATDGERIYAGIGNSAAHTTYTLGDGTVWNAGSWAALDARTGKFVWQIPIPGVDPYHPSYGPAGIGAVSVANGLMFAGSTAGDMVAIDAATGRICWRFASGGAVIDSPSVVEGTIYWGSGYSSQGPTNNKVFAFTLR